MGIKIYIGFSLLLLIAVGVSGYGLETGEYEIVISKYSLTLPIIAWVLAPAVVLFIFSVLHLMFYGSVNYCKNRGFNKDESTVVDAIKTLLLQKDNKSKFKTKGYKNVASILNQFNLDVKDSTFTSTDEGLNKIVSQIKDIKAGKYINEKPLKLDARSDLAKQNLINKMSEQPDFSLDILKKSTNYSSEIVRVAFFNVLENKSMTTVKKVYKNATLDKEMALKLFLKDIDNSEFGLSKEEILKITKSLNYSKEEYITLAKLYKDGLTPDKLLGLFESISEDTEIAMDAYFYVLLELEMIDKIKELLTGYPEDEFTAFRALLDLKDAGKHYSLDDISYN